MKMLLRRSETIPNLYVSQKIFVSVIIASAFADLLLLPFSVDSRTQALCTWSSNHSCWNKAWYDPFILSYHFFVPPLSFTSWMNIVWEGTSTRHCMGGNAAILCYFLDEHCMEGEWQLDIVKSSFFENGQTASLPNKSILNDTDQYIKNQLEVLFYILVLSKQQIEELFLYLCYHCLQIWGMTSSSL